MTASLELWKGSGWVLGGCAALLALWAFPRGTGEDPDPAPWFRRFGLCLGGALVAAGVWLRVTGLDEFQGGMLSGDESWASIVYVSDFVHGLAPHRSLGASLATFALLVDGWNHVFGFEPAATRHLTVALGLLTSALFYLGLRRLTDPSLAILATGLLCVSPFAVFFSRLALEPIYPVFFFAALLLAVAFWRDRPGPARAFPIGDLTGVGWFAYAAFPMALAALVLGSGTVLAISLARRGWVSVRDVARAGWGRAWSVAAMALGFLAVYAPMMALHVLVFGGGLFATGGGVAALSFPAIHQAGEQLLRDLFIEGDSWYLPWRGAPVLERALLPFAALGAVRSWRRYRNAAARGALLAAPILIALCTVAGPYPGMRRALVVLLPYHFCAAAGVLLTGRRLAASNGTTRAAGGPRAVLAMALIALCSLHAVVYQLAFGRAMVGSYRFAGGFTVEPPLPYRLLVDRLREGPVLLDAGEFGELDRKYYLSLVRLAHRYGEVSSEEELIHFSDDPDLASRDDWTLLTARVYGLIALSRSTGLCIPLSELRSALDDRTLFVVRLVSARDPGATIVCAGSPAHLASITSRLRLGFAHLEEGLRHELNCNGPYCDASRSESVYATGGDVSFLLRKPAPENAVALCLGVILTNVSVRENRILVNGHPVGSLSAATAGPNAEACFTVPGEASARDPLWRITIEAPAAEGKSGWDLLWAELRPPRT